MLALWLTATGETCYFRCGRESIATKVRAHSSEVKRSHSCTIWPTEPQNIHPQHLRSFCRGPNLSAVFIFYLHPCLCCITLHFTVMTCPSGLLLLSKCFVLKKDFHPFLMKIILWDEQLAVPLWPDVVPSVPVVVYLGLCGQNCRHLPLTNVVESLHKYVPRRTHTHTGRYHALFITWKNPVRGYLRWLTRLHFNQMKTTAVIAAPHTEAAST